MRILKAKIENYVWIYLIIWWRNKSHFIAHLFLDLTGLRRPVRSDISNMRWITLLVFYRDGSIISTTAATTGRISLSKNEITPILCAYLSALSDRSHRHTLIVCCAIISIYSSASSIPMNTLIQHLKKSLRSNISLISSTFFQDNQSDLQENLRFI